MLSSSPDAAVLTAADASPSRGGGTPGSAYYGTGVLPGQANARVDVVKRQLADAMSPVTSSPVRVGVVDQSPSYQDIGRRETYHRDYSY